MADAKETMGVSLLGEEYFLWLDMEESAFDDRGMVNRAKAKELGIGHNELQGYRLKGLLTRDESGYRRVDNVEVVEQSLLTHNDNAEADEPEEDDEVDVEVEEVKPQKKEVKPAKKTTPNIKGYGAPARAFVTPAKQAVLPASKPRAALVVVPTPEGIREIDSASANPGCESQDMSVLSAIVGLTPYFQQLLLVCAKHASWQFGRKGGAHIRLREVKTLGYNEAEVKTLMTLLGITLYSDSGYYLPDCLEYLAENQDRVG